MNICDKCKNYYPNNHYCQYWDCGVTKQHETCCGFANMTNADRIRAMTNADRIRAMSDEELRNWLFQRDCKNIAAFLQHGGAGVMDAAQLLDWLRQPAEEDDHAE